MDKLKLRAWDKKNEKMVDVIDFRCMNYPGKYKVVQYIGLKDKNGKEIFEGDIVEYEPNNIHAEKGQKDRYIVKINKLWFGAYPFRIHPWLEGTIEIIGNIYENPKLINK